MSSFNAIVHLFAFVLGCHLIFMFFRWVAWLGHHWPQLFGAMDRWLGETEASNSNAKLHTYCTVPNRAGPWGVAIMPLAFASAIGTVPIRASHHVQINQLHGTRGLEKSLKFPHEPNPLGNKARCLANRCTKVCNGPNFVKVIRDFLVFVGGRGQLDTT